MGCIPYIIDKTFAWTCGTHTTLQCYWQMKTKKSWRNCDQVPNWHQVDLRWPRPRSPDITCSLVRRPKQFKTWALVIYLDRKKTSLKFGDCNSVSLVAWPHQRLVYSKVRSWHINIYIYIFICIFIYLFIYLLIYLFIYLSIYLFIYFIFLYIYNYIYIC